MRNRPDSGMMPQSGADAAPGGSGPRTQAIPEPTVPFLAPGGEWTVFARRVRPISTLRATSCRTRDGATVPVCPALVTTNPTTPGTRVTVGVD